jgi:hypothetical protein
MTMSSDVTPLKELGTKALSWADVDEIVARFARLNPYDFADENHSILKIEDENFSNGERIQLQALCVSAKRYPLFHDAQSGGLELRKCSEHGLGHLLNPIDPNADQPGDRKRAPKWIECLWEVLIRRQRGESPSLPDWIDRPALSRVGATKPEIVRRLNQAQKRTPYAEQVKPTNFVLAAHVKPMGHPQGVDPEHFQLIAPYSSDPRQWPKLKWIDRYSGKAFPITTLDGGSSQVARAKSYRDVFEEYATHPEPKSAGPDARLEKLTGSNSLRRRSDLARVSYCRDSVRGHVDNSLRIARFLPRNPRRSQSARARSFCEVTSRASAAGLVGHTDCSLSASSSESRASLARLRF